MIDLTLTQLSHAVSGELRLAGAHTPDTIVSGGVDTDSRLMEPGGIFVAKPGDVTDGHLFVPAAVDNGVLVLRRRPDTTIRLTPLYKDAFSGSIGTVIFRRGTTMELSIVQDRVWDLRLTRRAPAQSTAQ